MSERSAPCQPESPAKPRRSDWRAAVRRRCALPSACNVDPSLHPGTGHPKDSWQATVQNLSAQGIGLVLCRRFEVGTILSVELFSADGAYSRAVEMRVAHVQPEGITQWLVGGILAEELSDADLQALL